MMPIARDSLIAAARMLRGVPFRHQGRDGRGVDCMGAVLVALRSCDGGIDAHWRELAARDGRPALPPGNAFDDPRYDVIPNPLSVRQWLDHAAIRKGKIDPMPGDLLVFSFRQCAAFIALATARDRVLAAFFNNRVHGARADGAAALQAARRLRDQGVA